MDFRAFYITIFYMSHICTVFVNDVCVGCVSGGGFLGSGGGRGWGPGGKDTTLNSDYG